MNVDLTAAEVKALLDGLGQSFDACDEEERRQTFHGGHGVNAAERARTKLLRALAQSKEAKPV